MDIALALSTITGAIGLVRELQSVDQQIDQADLKLKLAEVTSALADAKLVLTDARDELAEAEKQIDKLKQSFQTKTELVEKHGMLYRPSHIEGKDVQGFPACPVCMEQGTIMFLVYKGGDRRAQSCPKCKSSYNIKTYFFDDDPRL